MTTSRKKISRRVRKGSLADKARASFLNIFKRDLRIYCVKLWVCWLHRNISFEFSKLLSVYGVKTILLIHTVKHTTKIDVITVHTYFYRNFTVIVKS